MTTSERFQTGQIIPVDGHYDRDLNIDNSPLPIPQGQRRILLKKGDKFPQANGKNCWWIHVRGD